MGSPYVIRWVTVALYVFITDFAYIARAARANTFEAGARESGAVGEGDETREVFQATRKLPIDSPASTIFRRVLRTSYTHDTSYYVPRSGRNFLYGNQLSFDRCNRARARLCTCVNVVRRALPIARPDSSRDAVNMLIYWRRVRFEYTQVAKGYVWFLRDSFRWMTGMFVDISVNCCRRAEYWFPPVWKVEE